jgi:hypothetical protein
MDTKVGQMSKHHNRVGQMAKANQKMGAKVQGGKSFSMRNEPSPQQLQETAKEYNKYK